MLRTKAFHKSDCDCDCDEMESVLMDEIVIRLECNTFALCADKRKLPKSVTEKFSFDSSRNLTRHPKNID